MCEKSRAHGNFGSPVRQPSRDTEKGFIKGRAWESRQTELIDVNLQVIFIFFEVAQLDVHV